MKDGKELAVFFKCASVHSSNTLTKEVLFTEARYSPLDLNEIYNYFHGFLLYHSDSNPSSVTSSTWPYGDKASYIRITLVGNPLVTLSMGLCSEIRCCPLDNHIQGKINLMAVNYLPLRFHQITFSAGKSQYGKNTFEWVFLTWARFKGD